MLFLRGSVFFTLQVVALWFAVAGLAIISAIALIAANNRADCVSSPLPPTVIAASNISCTSQDAISATVHRYASYLQSTHIFLIHAIATLAMLVFKPALWEMAWNSLHSSFLSGSAGGPGMTMKLSALQSGMGLISSPGLIPSIIYAKDTSSIAPTVAFVMGVGILSAVSPFAVSPIYKPHTGPFKMTASVVNGGGVGPTISPSLNVTADPAAGGVVSGRALLNAGTILNKTTSPVTFNISVAAFIPGNAIDAIWNADIQTVAARNSLDCGPSAPARLTGGSQDVVSLYAPWYFPSDQEPTGATQPVYAGQVLGPINNDPVVTAVYLNSSTTADVGVVTAETSVVFLAANGTMEGAQQRITSPEPTARIAFVDVLTCTSTTRLEMSTCSVRNGAITGCTFTPTAGNSSSLWGGVEKYIANPVSSATILSVSPVTAYYSLVTRLPMLSVSQQIIDSKLPPLSFLTLDTAGPQYTIPMTYTRDVLFGQTAQGLVQGLVQAWPTYAKQDTSITATFGTSVPALTHSILYLSFIVALAATLASTWPHATRNTTELDVTRLLAISRNPHLDAALHPYSEADVNIHRDLMKTRVGYGWVEGLQRRALVVSDSGQVPHHQYQDTKLGGSSASVVPGTPGTPGSPGYVAPMPELHQEYRAVAEYDPWDGHPDSARQ